MKRIEEEIAQKSFNSIELKTYINLLYTAAWLNSRQNTFFRTYGITPQQYNVLRILRGHKSLACSLLVLKDRMIDRNCNVGRLVDKLESAGLLSKAVNPEDKRQVDLFITTEGLRLLEEIDVYIPSEYSVMSRISSKDLLLLNNLLDKLRG